MNTQETLAGYRTTEDFVKELSRHLKLTKTCDNSNLTSCFEDSVIWGDNKVEISTIKTAKDMGKEDWKTNIIGFQMANGVSGLVAYNPACTQDPYNNRKIIISGSITGRKGNVAFPGTDCIAMVYDVSGFTKPNTKDKDIKANVDTLAHVKSCFIELNGDCLSTPFIPTPLTKVECELYKNKLNIKTCVENDYWAGAKKACNDRGGKLFDAARLNDEIFGRDEEYRVIMKNKDLYNKFNGGSSFTLWRNYERDEYAYYSTFEADIYYEEHDDPPCRYSLCSNTFAVCLGGD